MIFSNGSKCLCLQVYRTQSEYWNGQDFKWEGDANVWKNRSNPSMKIIELVASPNNPDGRLMTATLKGPFAKPIYDYAHYWPHYSAIPYPADEDVMLFSLSKTTGHAGSRLGYIYLAIIFQLRIKIFQKKKDH